MRSYTVFQFTQRAIENHSTCHAWHACRRLPTPALHGEATVTAIITYTSHIILLYIKRNIMVRL
jgi:hypothetical protein